MDLVQRGFMSKARGMHRSNHSEVVGAFGKMWQRIGDPHAGFTMLGKFEWTLHQSAGRLWIFNLSGNLAEISFAMVLGQHGFRIEEIHLTWPAVHEELNDTSGTRRVVGMA